MYRGTVSAWLCWGRGVDVLQQRNGSIRDPGCSLDGRQCFESWVTDNDVRVTVRERGKEEGAMKGRGRGQVDSRGQHSQRQLGWGEADDERWRRASDKQQ